MTALEMATQLVNKWISECASLPQLPPNKRGIMLIQMIAVALDRVEMEAYERGKRDGVAE